MERKIIAGSGWCAVTEDGVLMEYLSDINSGQSGSVLLGKTDRLMPGMNCAFVDIGRKRSAFLPLNEESGSFAGGQVRSGETMILQVKKEETGLKGAYLTRDITLPGTYVILMPMNRYIGVSGRIRDEAVRIRLKEAGKRIADGRFGMVMRNAATEAGEAEIREEAERLFAEWQETAARADKGGKPGTVLRSDDPVTRLKEDYAAGGFEFVSAAGEPAPDIARQFREAGERTVRLKNGGNIVIDPCEAMTVIDVNTGSCTGKGSKERTVTETNLEACERIVQQIRLRNLGGIILIDFIDMEEEKDRNLVAEKLEERLQADRVKTVVHGWTNLGIIEMTRKRTGGNG